MKIILNFLRYFYIFIGGPPRFSILGNYMINKHLNLLDVGCGNYSPQNTKKYFPSCKYYGVDKYDVLNGKIHNSLNLEKFWIIDLEHSDMKEIPNYFFDIIVMSQVIEHLKKGSEVISNLAQKLKSNGMIYIEFPSYHTRVLPSMKKKGITFNFYDDETHVKLYKKKEIETLLINNNFKTIKIKTYFNWKKIIFIPFLIIIHYFKDKKEYLYELWWLVGWVSYAIAFKK